MEEKKEQEKVQKKIEEGKVQKDGSTRQPVNPPPKNLRPTEPPPNSEKKTEKKKAISEDKPKMLQIAINPETLNSNTAELIKQKIDDLVKLKETETTLSTEEYFLKNDMFASPEKKDQKYKRNIRTTIPKLLRELPPTKSDDPKFPNQRRKVGIIGFADTTRLQAPFSDPTWELWGLNELYQIIPRADRWFEIHCDHNIRHSFRDPKHWEWLKKCKIPVYMTKKYREIPKSLSWPKDKMIKDFGPVFSSSIAEMLATAIVEGFEIIGLWGVDMALKKEYGAQKSACEHLIGLALGMGIQVYIPPESDMLKVGFVYGYDDPHEFAVKMKEKNIELIRKLNSAKMAEREAHDGAMKLEGALTLNQYYQDNFVTQLAEEQFKHK